MIFKLAGYVMNWSVMLIGSIYIANNKKDQFYSHLRNKINHDLL